MKLRWWGSPARINTRPRWSQTTACTRWLDSWIPLRNSLTSRGGTPGRVEPPKLDERVMGPGSWDHSGKAGPKAKPAGLQSLAEGRAAQQQDEHQDGSLP